MSPHSSRSSCQRGITFTELVVVTVIASLVMAGLVSFYMNSQATWMDGSAQAITQREATTLMEDITARVHRSAAALAPSANHLDLFDAGDLVNPSYGYQWVDSLVHEGPFDGGSWSDRGPSVGSIAERFNVSVEGPLVRVTLGLRSAQGHRIEVSTQVALLNR